MTRLESHSGEATAERGAGTGVKVNCTETGRGWIRWARGMGRDGINGRGMTELGQWRRDGGVGALV